MADAGIGATWRPSRARTSRAWPAAGTFDISWIVSDARQNPRAGHDTRPPRALNAAMTPPVSIGAGPLAIEDVVAIARGGSPVALTEEALAAIDAGRAVIEALADDVRPHYGVSTGFGALAQRHIPSDRRTQLQRSLIRSHAAGSGP